KSADDPSHNETFVETALKLGGKSEEEARKTGALDRADEQVEDLFAPKYHTSGSPVHRAVGDAELPLDLFVAPDTSITSDESLKVMDASLAVVRERRLAGQLLDERRKLTPETLNALAEAGYWGLLVDQQFGGSGASFNAFARFL